MYGLILNSFKNLYSHIGMFYFQSAEARLLAKRFYANLMDICQRQAIDEVAPCVLQYGKDSGASLGKYADAITREFCSRAA